MELSFRPGNVHSHGKKALWGLGTAVLGMAFPCIPSHFNPWLYLYFPKLNVFLCIAAISYKLGTWYSSVYCHLYFGSSHVAFSSSLKDDGKLLCNVAGNGGRIGLVAAVIIWQSSFDLMFKLIVLFVLYWELSYIYNLFRLYYYVCFLLLIVITYMTGLYFMYGMSILCWFQISQDPWAFIRSLRVTLFAICGLLAILLCCTFHDHSLGISLKN